MSAVRRGPGLHRPRPGGQVRRLLPRALRHAAGRRGQRRGHPRACPGRPASRRRPWPTPSWCPTTSCPSSTSAWPASSWSRWRPTWAWWRPRPGFLEGLRRRLRRRRRAPRVRRGHHRVPGRPRRGMSARVGVTPDLWCFGKVIGGGLPVGAFGGRRDVLAVLAPDGPVYQAGTLSGNPLATAAGLAVLETVAAGGLRRAVPRGPGAWPTGLRDGHLRGRDRRPGPGGGTARRASSSGPSRSPTTRRPGPRWRAASTRRSSRPCSSGGWPWPPAPTRPCSRAWPISTPTSTPWWRPPPRRPPTWRARARHVALTCSLAEIRRRDPWSRRVRVPVPGPGRRSFTMRQMDGLQAPPAEPGTAPAGDATDPGPHHRAGPRPDAHRARPRVIASPTAPAPGQPIARGRSEGRALPPTMTRLLVVGAVVVVVVGIVLRFVATLRHVARRGADPQHRPAAARADPRGPAPRRRAAALLLPPPLLERRRSAPPTRRCEPCRGC